MLTPQGIAELQNVLRQLKTNGLAIIFITHKLHEAIAIGDRITILSQGRVVGDIDQDVLSASTPHQLRQRHRRDDVRQQLQQATTDVAAATEEVEWHRTGRRLRRRCPLLRSSRRHGRAEARSRSGSSTSSLEVHEGARSWASPA